MWVVIYMIILERSPQIRRVILERSPQIWGVILERNPQIQGGHTREESPDPRGSY